MRNGRLSDMFQIHARDLLVLEDLYTKVSPQTRTSQNTRYTKLRENTSHTASTHHRRRMCADTRDILPKYGHPSKQPHLRRPFAKAAACHMPAHGQVLATGVFWRVCVDAMCRYCAHFDATCGPCMCVNERVILCACVRLVDLGCSFLGFGGGLKMELEIGCVLQVWVHGYPRI